MAIDKEVRIWKRNVNRNCLYWRCCACTVNFICPHPVPADEQEKPLDKVKEPPRACRSREREER